MGIKATAMDIQAKESTNEEHSKVKKKALDNQAILTVIVRRKNILNYQVSGSLNLQITCLQGANLKDANL
jgi:hypothetical protein